MAKAKSNNPDPPMKRHIKPATDPKTRETQLISMAVDRVEQRLMDGTASAQEIIHFLRLGSTEKQLELEKLRHENELLKAKTDAIKEAQEVSKMFAEAVAAMTSYRMPTEEDYEEDDE